MADGGVALLVSYTSIRSSTATTAANHSTSIASTSETQDLILHELTDDRATGGFGPWGTVDYVNKIVNVKLVDKTKTTNSYNSDYENAESFESSLSGSPSASGSDARKGGAYNSASVGEEVLSASSVRVSYTVSATSSGSGTTTADAPPITIDLCPYTKDQIVPNSVRFTWMGHVYEDYDGSIVRDRTTDDAGTVSGTIDYVSGVAALTDYEVGPNPQTLSVQSLWTTRRSWLTASIFMRTQAAPLRPTGFVMNLSDSQGNAITATGDALGAITGTHLRGKITYETGEVDLQFGDYVLDSSLTAAQKAEWWYDADDVGAVEVGKIWRPWPVDPTTLRYNSVAYFYLPLDAELLGIDPVRLPQDGRVVIYQPGGRAVIGHTKVGSPTTVSNGQTINLARVRLSRVRVIGNDGATINTGYTTDLEAGTVTFTNVTGYSQPVTIEDRIEDMVLITDVGIDGSLKFGRQVTHAYPVPGSYVSSALMTGDLRSRNSVLFDQASWDGSWVDTQVGSAATGTYNDILSPIEVSNVGASTERFALRFTSTTAFQIIGAHVGVIGTGTITTDTSPINPATNEPYFTIRALGWGTGWSVGNVLRINTVGALFPLWIARTVQPGPEAGIDYSFSLLTRGSVDRPPSAP